MAFRTKFVLGKQCKEETVHALINLPLEFTFVKVVVPFSASTYAVNT
jgi:hypothetical protein